MFFFLIALTSETIVFGALSPEITVRSIEGVSVTGQLIDWSDEEVIIGVSDGEQKIPFADLEEITFAAASQTAPPPVAGSTAVRIRLVDRTELIADSFITDENGAEIAWGTDGQQTIPLSWIRSVRFAVADDSLRAAWERLRAKPRRSDRLAVRKGKEIDYVDGVISKVTAERVDFLLDGESLPVKRTKLAGLLFADRAAESMQAAKCQLVTVRGSQIPLSEWECLPAGFALRSPAGLLLEIPYDQVRSIDFLRDKIIYLSELEPVLAEWTPYLAAGKLDATLARFYGPQKDHAVGKTGQKVPSAPLQIVGLPTEDPVDGSLRPSAIESYDEGLALHSKSHVVYDLPEDARRFEARVGIDASTVQLGNVHFQILGDGQTLFAENISGATGPRDVSLDISGVQRLELLVDYGENQDMGDRLNLCNARIVK